MIDRRSFSQKKRAAICLAQGGKCAVCKEKLWPGKYQIDHIAALVHGGSNDDDNLRAICLNCHKAKTRKDVQARSRADCVAAGGKTRKGPPMAGSRLSRYKKKMSGEVVRR